MRCFWTEEEDENLKKAVEICKTQGRIQWKAISKSVGTRTPRQCMQRWIDVLRPGIKKGTWSKYEDIILQRVITLHGFRNWTEIARLIPKRTAKQCRERWHQNLAPHLSKQPFSTKDDELLLKLFENYGSKWTVIAKHFKNRSANLIKCRWKSLHRQHTKLNIKGKIQQQTKKNYQDEQLNLHYSTNVCNPNKSSIPSISYPSSTISTILPRTVDNDINVPKDSTNLSVTRISNTPPSIPLVPMKEQIHFTWSIFPMEHVGVSELDKKKSCTQETYCNCESHGLIGLVNNDQNRVPRVSEIDGSNYHISPYRHYGRSVYLNEIVNENCISPPINGEHYLRHNTMINNFGGYEMQAPPMHFIMCGQNQFNPECFCSHNHYNSTMNCNCFASNTY